MATPGLNVLARFEAKPGQEDRVRAALVKMIDPTLQENANIGYALHQSTDDPRLFVLYEQWSDEAGLKNHMAQPYFHEMDQALEGALERPYEVVKMTGIGGEVSPVALAGSTS